MSKILDRLSLKESIELTKKASEVKEKLNSKLDKPFRIVWLSKDEFKFISNTSYGTFFIDKSGPLEGIKGFAKIITKNNGRIKIKLRTKFRTEIYLIIITFLIASIISIRSDEKYTFWLFLFLLPICVSLFWFLYRHQEKKLFKKLKEHMFSK